MAGRVAQRVTAPIRMTNNVLMIYSGVDWIERNARALTLCAVAQTSHRQYSMRTDSRVRNRPVSKGVGKSGSAGARAWFNGNSGSIQSPLNPNHAGARST